MTLKQLSISFTTITLIGTTAIALYALSIRNKTPELPVLSKPAPFTLTDHTGSEWDTRSLQGKVWIANFIFTRCPSICPTLQEQFQVLQKVFSGQKNIHFISITIDPGFDTPEQLSKHIASKNINTENWTFLTGDIENIRKILIDGFKIASPEDPNLHTDRFVLMDELGQIRAYYALSNQEQIGNIPQDIKNLLK